MKEQLDWMLDCVDFNGQRVYMREFWNKSIENINSYELILYLGEQIPENILHKARRTFNENLEPNEAERNLEIEKAVRQVHEGVLLMLVKLGIRSLVANKQQS